jgi:quercetin dioxygenase-like cupin family protein
MLNNRVDTHRVRIYSSVFVLAALAASGTAVAQVSPPSWTASPDVYKVVAESGQFRVVEGTWKPGQRDLLHSHPSGGFVYFVTDCSLRLHSPDGTTEDVSRAAGAASSQPAYDSHWAENAGKETCKLVLFEPK